MLKKVLSVFVSVALILALTITSYAGIVGDTGDACVFSESYGSHERQKYEAFFPWDHDADFGVVLFIHGGAYTSGDKSSYWEQCEAVSSKGYAAATMNYRYMDENVSLHDILDDIDACLESIKELGAKWGINISKVLLRGYSAGGHLAMLYAYSRKDTSPIPVTAVVSDAGGPADCSDPYFYRNNILFDAEGGADFMSRACDRQFTFATRLSARKELLAISPITYIGYKPIPTILSYGYLDTIIPYSHGALLASTLYNNGCPALFFIEYGNSDHALNNDSKKERETEERFNEFVKYYVGT